MKSIVLFLSCLFCSLSFLAQDCAIPESLNQSTMKIIFDTSVFETGVYHSVEAHIKMPKKSNEVLAFDKISCTGFMPKGAKVIYIKVIDVLGLPEGISWACNQEDCKWKGGTTGCVRFSGTPTTKGIYPLHIKVEGLGSLFGIKKNLPCSIDGYSIIVE